MTLICATFGKDLFNISKVIKQSGPGFVFLDYPVDTTVVKVDHVITTSVSITISNS